MGPLKAACVPEAVQAADRKKTLHEVTKADRYFCKTHFHGRTISVHKPIREKKIQILRVQNGITQGGVNVTALTNGAVVPGLCCLWNRHSGAGASAENSSLSNGHYAAN